MLLSLLELCVAAIPAALTLGALGAALSPVAHTFRWVRAATATAVALTLLTTGIWLQADASTGLWFQVDALSLLMLGLVSFIGAVLARYSRSYLRGEPGLRRYGSWFLLALACVTALVTTGSLWVLGLAWLGTSLALHQLLTFYPERPQALIAAHKKFLLARLADTAFLGAAYLVYQHTQSQHIAPLLDDVAALETLPVTLHWAAVLLALATALKCAQLPFHGWLIQVMEAPTPVSALLHAGIVNIGGFVMIRLAPLMLKAEPAQLLLVAAGGSTLLVAALVMTTRNSVKEQLAWSTCAQMGFMLVECGLGAYRLALLHLLAHSLYKAHAFLSAGSTVDRWRSASMLARGPRPSLSRMLAAGTVALWAAFALAASAHDAELRFALLLWAMAVSPALATLRGLRLALAGLAGALLTAGLAVVWHALLAPALGALTFAPHPLALSLALGSLGTLFVLQLWLSAYPNGQLARRLYPVLASGLAVDELFTRLTFRLWPARRAARASRPATFAQTQEA